MAALDGKLGAALRDRRDGRAPRAVGHEDGSRLRAQRVPRLRRLLKLHESAGANCLSDRVSVTDDLRLTDIR